MLRNAETGLTLFETCFVAPMFQYCGRALVWLSMEMGWMDDGHAAGDSLVPGLRGGIQCVQQGLAKIVW